MEYYSLVIDHWDRTLPPYFFLAKKNGIRGLFDLSLLPRSLKFIFLWVFQIPVFLAGYSTLYIVFTDSKRFSSTKKFLTSRLTRTISCFRTKNSEAHVRRGCRVVGFQLFLLTQCINRPSGQHTKSYGKQPIEIDGFRIKNGDFL